MKKKQLYRYRNPETQLGGVSIGMAEYFGIDVTLVRVLFVILFFTPFPALITYLVFWAVLPEYQGQPGLRRVYDGTTGEAYEPTQTGTMFTDSRTQKGSLVGGAALIALGLIFSFKTFFDINLFGYLRDMWPLLLIGLGVWLIARDKNNVTDPTHYSDEAISDPTNDLLP